MGSVIGKISEETPHFESVGRIKDIEIRSYDAVYMASVSSTDVPTATTQNEFTGTAFRALAKYIGVFATPENKPRDGTSEGGEAIAMTAPVVMNSNESMAAEGGEPIAMTAPVVMTDNASGDAVDTTMSFILPSKYIKGDKLPPVPLDPRVKLTKMAPRLMAVKTFSGDLTKEIAANHAADVIGQLALHGTTYSVKHTADGKPVWEYMGYNPPWTLPWCKTNEVGVLLVE
ncbi:Aste57867_12452 [Aphanomyces stellatus]|uniref:Aste57867_12452 protein n=1 Tax=Aphanomyces stellatus TaxID=120398 RepID=A0A485KW77_9STRA|nr:hypothetical protein As57867_012406 [Aphanomyces stellatus]VFT89303.1 Aste57867_12452 [Aphanomyces stellatus]